MTSEVRCLDPRFGELIEAIGLARTSLEVQDARAEAVRVAQACGFSFDGALRELRQPSPPAAEDAGEAEPEPSASYPSTTGEIERVAAVRRALAADPGQSDRSIARACRCSPTTVGRARAAAGLMRGAREVCRGGSTYAMRLGRLAGPGG